ncbi:MFS transporter [Bacillus sp. HMF5848]|uniref:MFS transporter n=1 Tax=Bacillus sp. HMF5848 TaxID=2495421 RepID=UPI000F78C92E|nr:MFS transporter [Bacillus sp. HMF5848]RSK27233.1 MFS transporter [Bacillus sp. HMF5848]
MNRNRILWTMAFAQFLVMQVWFNFSAVMPIVQVEWHLNGTQSGLIVAFFHVGYVLAVFFYSFLSDNYNPKYSFIYGALIAGISGVLFGLFANNFIAALFLRVISGIGVAGIYVPGMKLLAELFSVRERGRAFGVYVGSLVAGSGFSLFVSGLIINQFGWRAVIVLTSIASLIAAVMMMLSKLPDITIQQQKITLKDVTRVIKKKNLLVNLGYAGHCWELYAMWAWIGPFMVHYFTLKESTHAVQIGNLTASCIIMIGAFASYNGGRLSDTWGRTKTIQFFIIISIACSLIIGWLTILPIWMMVLLALIYGYTIIADSPVYNTLLTEITDKDVLGISLGVQSVMGFSFTIVSPFIFGILLDIFGYGVAFSILGIITVMTPLCLKALSKTLKLEEA